eukprot:1366968-Pyramimonas_sp.AAC.1
MDCPTTTGRGLSLAAYHTGSRHSALIVVIIIIIVITIIIINITAIFIIALVITTIIMNIIAVIAKTTLSVPFMITMTPVARCRTMLSSHKS